MEEKLKLGKDIIEGIKENLKYQYQSGQITIEEYIALLRELENSK